MGVNLLPFIDWQRLLDVAKIADQNEELLTPAERIRNKPTGQVRLYFQQDSEKSKSKLQQSLLSDFKEKSNKSEVKVDATFQNLDGIQG